VNVSPEQRRGVNSYELPTDPDFEFSSDTLVIPHVFKLFDVPPPPYISLNMRTPQR